MTISSGVKESLGIVFVLFLLIAAAPAAAIAQSLSVSPTNLLVPAPGLQATLIIKADGSQISVVQARVMAWKESDDPSVLKSTRDVAISPPATQLRPGQELTLRIVRVSKKPVRKRECYRVLVDRLPGQEQAGEGIQLQVRHSIPLCFTP